jgi:non-canonical (house-cleaning) NTP pyrophosphatase
MKRIGGWMAAFAILALLFGCASEKKVQGGGSSASPACNIDAKAVCQTVRNQPVVSAQTGILEDQTSREQNSSRTGDEFLQYTLESGNSVTVQCYINTHTNAVIYARASTTKPLSAQDAELLRSQGLCTQ